MEQLARTLIFLEMLFINLITTHSCSKKRYSSQVIIFKLTLYTIFILLISFFIRFKLNLTYLNGGILILLGLTYFFPLKHLYDEPADKTLSIMFFSWTHTMAVTYFSMQMATLFKFESYFQVSLIIQTAIYFFSTPVIIKFVKGKFLYILKNITSEMNKYLIILSFVEFATLSIIFLYFIESSNSFWKVVTIILVALSAAISYHLIYIIVRNFKSIKFLSHLAYTDNLTGIKNRLALFLDCEELIAESKPFYIIYMDLDNFKIVNDTYGHAVGDNYLKKFTKATIETVSDRGSLYRMSGDEFVCLYKENRIDINSFLAAFEKKITKEMDIPFLGVSIGYAKFPQDANSIDGLIQKADTVMYEIKKSKPR